MKRIKYIAIGLIAGLCINNISAIASSIDLVVSRVTYPVMVNDNPLQSDKPVLNYEGSTYLPLKAIADSLGVKVAWNSELGRVEINNSVACVASPTPSPMPTVKPTLIPSPTPTMTPSNLKEIDMFGLDADVYFNIGGKKYKSRNKYYFPNDKDNKIYISYPMNPIDRFTNSSPLVLNAVFNEPIITKSDNPYIDGLVSWDISDKYSSLERKFIDAKTCYIEGYLYNSDRTKSYYINTKQDELKGVVKSSMYKVNTYVYVPVEELYKQLGIQCTISYDKKSNELLFNIVK